MKLTLCQANGYSLVHARYHNHTPVNNIVLLEGDIRWDDNRLFLGDKEIAQVKPNGHVNLNSKVVLKNLGYITTLRNQIRYLFRTRAPRVLH
jgi:hypothetical protein